MTMRKTHGWAHGWTATGLALLASLSLAGCGGGSAPGDADGEWAGTLRTEQGHCPDRAPSRLLVDAGTISFIPAGGVLTLTGHRVAGSPRLHAQLSLTDINHTPLPMVFEGTLAPDSRRVDGQFGTPACHASVVLLRPTDHGLQRALGN